MIRILHVIGKMDRAGAETAIMNFYRKIDRSKIQFDFMVFTKDKADYDDEIRNMGGRIFSMPGFEGYNYFALCRNFRSFFEKYHYPIVHGHIGSLAPAYLKYAKRNGAFTIAHSHATNSNIISERIPYWLMSHRVVYVADYFFACSLQAGIDRYGKRIVNSNRFSVLNNAIDAKDYIYSVERHEKLKKKFGLQYKTVFGHVGRFAKSKNHHFLLEVFEEIVRKKDDAVLVLVGRGETQDNIKKQVQERKLESHVIFLGVRNDISDLMNLFDAFLFPSQFEGLGIVAIEAQAAGLACFMSDVLPKESIITKNTFCLSLHKSAVEWKEFILDIIDSYHREDTYDSIVQAGWDIEENTKKLERFYLKHI